ncbi:MAG: hypothetical protein QMD85_01750 [Candidatus Aenigmarchaeota archaeon]|nr:hypothetical protein [Candidatus Aenigmarchaeota archaeon]MDI6722277.1 hypothetical protein [Candidatus Aenigmarchaeota archaeon]
MKTYLIKPKTEEAAIPETDMLFYVGDITKLNGKISIRSNADRVSRRRNTNWYTDVEYKIVVEGYIIQDHMEKIRSGGYSVREITS